MTINHLPVHAKREEQVILPTFSVKGRTVSVAPLQTVSLAKLRSGESLERQKLGDAVEYPGAFYLRLDDAQAAVAGSLSSAFHQSALAAASRRWPDIIRHPSERSSVMQVDLPLESVQLSKLPPLLQSSTGQFERIDAVASMMTRVMASFIPNGSRDRRRLKMLSTTGNSTVEARRESSLRIIFPASKADACTTAIHLPGAGIGEDRDWATVVPKDGCALVLANGTRHRIPELLPGEESRFWIELEIA